MSCTISTETIDKAVAFHGHRCPGLAIGIRAAELAIRELGEPEIVDMVAVCETDMCGVDAIQVITNCTYGKGNLMHRDYGKMAFSFYSRKDGAGFRALLKPDVRQGIQEELTPLMKKISSGVASDEERDQAASLRASLEERFLTLKLEDLFETTPLRERIPRPAAILGSLTCEVCGESVMESRTRRFDGKTLCIPCFNDCEQKV